ncbi:hypothetical protein [Longibacter sp.]|uniref:hypothetical protein n=1 Tax=Longibacter sp. TaxID=2045415 RepID=UPI003EBF35B4
MADRQDSNAAAPTPPSDWLANEWSELCDVLGTSDPEEVLPRVRTLKKNMDRIDEEAARPQESFVTISEVEEVFRELNERLRKLRERNAQLVEQLEEEGEEGVETAFKELHRETEELLEALGVASVEEGMKRVDSMNRQLENLYREKEILVEAGYTQTSEALEEIDTLREKLQSDESKPDTSVFHAATTIRNMIGVSTIGEAEDLVHAIRQLHARLGDLAGSDHDPSDHDDSADDLSALVDEMDERLSTVERERNEDATSNGASIPDEVTEVLGVQTLDDAKRLAEMVTSLGDRVQAYHAERERINEETGVRTADGVLEMIASMEEQLVDLYEHQQDSLAPEVGDILGVRTESEARELVSTVRVMGERLEQYRSEPARVGTELSVEDVDGVLEMIHSMEEQLVDLYAYVGKSLDPEVGNVLGIQSHQEARDLRETVASIGNTLAGLGVSGEDASPPAETPHDSTVLDGIRVVEEEVRALRGRLVAPEAAEAETTDASEPEATGIGRVLGVTSVDEAEELAFLVQDMTDQLERLTEEQEKLDRAGLTAEQAIAMIDTMEEQLVDLYQDRAEGRADGEIIEQAGFTASRHGAADPAAEAESEVLEILGVGTPDEAHELADLVHSMSNQLDRLTEDQEKLVEAGLTVETALQMIDSMEEQLVELYEDREATRQAADEYGTVQSVLGVTTPEEARELADAVRSLHEEIREMQAEQAGMLEETGTSSTEDVLALIRSMEEQLADLYREREQSTSAAQQLDAIEDALGVRSGEEAREIARMAREMNDEIAELEQEREALNDVGLRSVDDAISMIASMQDQLEELYQERESTTRRASALDEGQDTFQQLEALYAEQEKLERELGLSSADDVIEMVEGLATQLDDLYRDRESVEDLSEDVQAFVDEHAAEEDASVMLASMEQQLRDLYKEKERLIDLGYGSADEAAKRIETLEQKRSELARASAECRERFDRLERELGVSGVEGILSLVRDASGAGSARSADPSLPSSSEATPSPGASDGDHPGYFIDAAPAFVPASTLSRLEEMSSDQLDDLDIGVIRLSDRGVVQFVNETGLELPGLRRRKNKTTILGKNFFYELAPSTNNNLFFGRFKEGLNQGAMDARFPYTFISPGQGPKVLMVHLHSKPDSDAQWLLFSAM